MDIFVEHCYCEGWTPYSNKTLPLHHVWTSSQFKNVKADVVMFGYYVCYDVTMTSSLCHVHVNAYLYIFLWQELDRLFLLGHWLVHMGPYHHSWIFKFSIKILFLVNYFRILKIFGNFSKVKWSLSYVPFLINEQINLVRLFEMSRWSSKYATIRCESQKFIQIFLKTSSTRFLAAFGLTRYARTSPVSAN